MKRIEIAKISMLDEKANRYTTLAIYIIYMRPRAINRVTIFSFFILLCGYAF